MLPSLVLRRGVSPSLQLVFESSCLTWSEQQVLILFNGEENPCSGNTEEGRVEGTPLRTAPSRGHWIMPSCGPGLAWMQLLLQRHVLVGQKLSVAVTCECCLQLSVALRKHSWSSQFHVPPCTFVRLADRYRSQLHLWDVKVPMC